MVTDGIGNGSPSPIPDFCQVVKSLVIRTFCSPYKPFQITLALFLALWYDSGVDGLRPSPLLFRSFFLYSPAMRRPIPQQDLENGQDSFLDVVSNIVGILIILVVVVGAQVKSGLTSSRLKELAQKEHAQIAAAEAEDELTFPLPAPEEESPGEEAARTLCALADGLLLTGGADVDPALYREETLPQCGRIDAWRAFVMNAGRPAGKDDAFRMACQNVLKGRTPGNDFGIDMAFADAAGDELGILAAEIEDQDLLVAGHGDLRKEFRIHNSEFRISG